MEGVRILHGEFAHADKPCARAGFIAEFGLDLVDHKRVFRVALAIFPHKLHSRLLMRHAKHHRASVAIAQAHQLAAYALIPARFLPQGSWQHDRELNLLAINCIHLLADNGLDLARNAAERHKRRKNPVGNIFHVAATQH